MALDEPRETDESFDIEGFQYIVDKDFLERAKPIKVDFLVHGFKLDCGLTFADGCTSCGSSGTCG
jgi:Fe-S cluster assembly iron-binding protein IscA